MSEGDIVLDLDALQNVRCREVQTKRAKNLAARIGSETNYGDVT